MPMSEALNSKRQEVFSNRASAVYYLQMVKNMDGLLEEAQASHSGNIDRSSGNISQGLNAVGNVAEAAPVVGSFFKAFLSASSMLAGFFNRNKIEEQQTSALDLLGDAEEKSWSQFARELALELTLQNQNLKKIPLEPGVETHRKGAVNDSHRRDILSLAKKDFGKVLDCINKTDPAEVEAGLNISDDKFRTNLVAQISENVAEQNGKSMIFHKHESGKELKNPKDLAKQAVEEATNSPAEGLGPHALAAKQKSHSTIMVH